MKITYQEICTVKGTVFRLRPTLLKPPRTLTDMQALPPASWCPLCGMEVYNADNTYCDTCRKYNG